jgi:hypothetical protein
MRTDTKTAMAGFLLMVLLFAVIGAATAQTACPWNADCITWKPSDLKYTTGETFPATELASYRIETATSTAGPWTVVANVLPPAVTYTRQPVSGTNYYRVIVVLKGGAIAAPSNVDDSVTVQPSPNPVVIESVVYNTGTFDPKQWMVRRNKVYGTIALDTECDGTRPAADGYYRVPVALVKWTNPLARTPYPLAKCEAKS